MNINCQLYWNDENNENETGNGPLKNDWRLTWDLRERALTWRLLSGRCFEITDPLFCQILAVHWEHSIIFTNNIGPWNGTFKKSFEVVCFWKIIHSTKYFLTRKKHFCTKRDKISCICLFIWKPRLGKKIGNLTNDALQS